MAIHKYQSAANNPFQTEDKCPESTTKAKKRQNLSFRLCPKDSPPTSALIGSALIRSYVRPEAQNPPIRDYTQVPTAWNPDDYDIPE
ncbi:uncharacterized protein N7469_000025 [Penicillium citrinum]|uniref:Uncharacterized protein n=1 Tax=Penicillium citrinum TaxID=5077 RepID=A0A9W9PC75_PENCI|nr:uncharacterized protein N7469_000025 [Penicillium citrinum]KAJ5241698.1 hypothetical protein N7469_000025 [Penicillium citrinum]